MQSLRTTAVTAARRSRTSLPRQSRRYAHDEHTHGHSQPVNEPIGKGFWGTVAFIPAGWAIYYLSRSESPDSPPFFTRLIDRYTEAQDKIAATNDLHTQMMEQAGSDRVLFRNTKSQDYIDMKFPEIMNNGSPFNVPAGSQANMDKVIAKYKKEANEDNERKLDAIRNGTIKSEQPFEILHVPREKK